MTVAQPSDSPASVPVVWNPRAGQKVPGTTERVDDARLRELLSVQGMAADVIVAQTPEDAVAAVRRAVAAGHRLVVAAGGDGTIGRLGIELLGKDVALGILPLGTIMNIPRMLGIPRDLDEAARVLAARRMATIDVGEANGRVFFETASVGMNAAMFRAAQYFENGDWGSPLRVLSVALRYRPARMQITLDDDQRVHTRSLMVTVSNGAYTGVGMTVAPMARLNDGRLDVRVFRHFSKFELLRHLASIMFGRRSYTPHVSTYRSAFVRVDGRRPLPCRADAQDLGTTPLECRVRPASLQVVVGPGYADGRAESHK